MGGCASSKTFDIDIPEIFPLEPTRCTGSTGDDSLSYMEISKCKSHKRLLKKKSRSKENTCVTTLMEKVTRVDTVSSSESIDSGLNSGTDGCSLSGNMEVEKTGGVGKIFTLPVAGYVEVEKTDSVGKKTCSEYADSHNYHYFPRMPGSCQQYPLSVDSSGYSPIYGREMYIDISRSIQETSLTIEKYKSTESNAEDALKDVTESNAEDALKDVQGKGDLMKAVLEVKRRFPNIRTVWPATDVSCNEDVIFIFEEDIVHLPNAIGDFRIVTTDANVQDIEITIAKKILENYHFLRFDNMNAKYIKEWITEFSSEMIDSHQNISMVSGCPFRITNNKIEKGWCFVIYCCGKGFIPVGDDPFPSHYRSVPVDIREGLFLKSGNHKQNKDLPTAAGCNDTVSIGSEIQFKNTGLAGTLGCFVEIEKDDEKRPGILTCAHVAFPHDSLDNCMDIIEKEDIFAYQNSKPIGKVYHARFSTGNGKSVSIDAAIVSVNEKELPEYSEFTKADNISTLNDLGFSNENPPCFCNGEYAKSPEEYGPECFKYGSTTGLTRGVICFDSAIINCELGLTKNLPKKKIYRQLHILPTVSDFFRQGDSGAIVFQISRKADKIIPIALAMAIGNYNNGCVATNIPSILKAFKQDQKVVLKKFNCSSCLPDSGIGMTDPFTIPKQFAWERSTQNEVSSARNDPLLHESHRRKKAKRKHSGIQSKMDSYKEEIFLKTNSGITAKGCNISVKLERDTEKVFTEIIGDENSSFSLKTPDNNELFCDGRKHVTTIKTQNETILIKPREIDN